MTESTEIVIKNPTPLGTQTLAGADDVVSYGKLVASRLASIVEERELYTIIGSGNKQKKYTHVEGWTTMLAMLGISPREVTEEGRKNEDGSYTSVVELVKTSDGMVVGKASAICGTPDEPRWAKAPEYARKSMATTRATSKAARLSFSWIMELAGYSPTPFEEMDGVIDGSFTEKKAEDGFRKPVCYEHGDPIPLVWREGNSKDGEPYAFWGCRHWAPDGGCQTTSNAPGPKEQELADDYWDIVDVALEAGTDMSNSYVETGFTKAMLGDPILVKHMAPELMELVYGYWTIVAGKEELPESEHLGEGEDYRDGRKAFAKYVLRHGVEAECSYVEAYETTRLMLEAGDLVFAYVKLKGNRKRLDLLNKDEVGNE